MWQLRNIVDATHFTDPNDMEVSTLYWVMKVSLKGLHPNNTIRLLLGYMEHPVSGIGECLSIKSLATKLFHSI